MDTRLKGSILKGYFKQLNASLPEPQGWHSRRCSPGTEVGHSCGDATEMVDGKKVYLTWGSILPCICKMNINFPTIYKNFSAILLFVS